MLLGCEAHVHSCLLPACCIEKVEGWRRLDGDLQCCKRGLEYSKEVQLPAGHESLAEQSIDRGCRLTGYEPLAGKTGATYDVAYVLLCADVCVGHDNTHEGVFSCWHPTKSLSTDANAFISVIMAITHMCT